MGERRFEKESLGFPLIQVRALHINRSWLLRSFLLILYEKPPWWRWESPVLLGPLWSQFPLYINQLSSPFLAQRKNQGEIAVVWVWEKLREIEGFEEDRAKSLVLGFWTESPIVVTLLLHLWFWIFIHITLLWLDSISSPFIFMIALLELTSVSNFS